MRKLWWMTVAVLALTIAAYQNPQVLNVEQAEITRTDLTFADVQRGILAAGPKPSWMMQVVAPGHIVATHTRSSYSATVDIFFASNTRSILHKDSQNLEYEDGTIHGTYNRWVQYLKQDIALYMQTV